MCDVWNDISSYSGLCVVVLSVWPGCVNIPQHDLCTVHGNNNLCVLMDRSDTRLSLRTWRHWPEITDCIYTTAFANPNPFDVRLWFVWLFFGVFLSLGVDHNWPAWKDGVVFGVHICILFVILHFLVPSLNISLWISSALWRHFQVTSQLPSDEGSDVIVAVDIICCSLRRVHAPGVFSDGLEIITVVWYELCKIFQIDFASENVTLSEFFQWLLRSLLTLCGVFILINVQFMTHVPDTVKIYYMTLRWNYMLKVSFAGS